MLASQSICYLLFYFECHRQLCSKLPTNSSIHEWNCDSLSSSLLSHLIGKFMCNIKFEVEVFFSEKIVSKHKTHSRFFCLFHKKRVIYGHCCIQTRSYLSSCLQIHSKWIKGLNVIQWNSEIYNGKEGFCLIRASLIPHLRSFLMWWTAVNAETCNSSKCRKQVSVG